jgi:hypothetical protein
MYKKTVYAFLPSNLNLEQLLLDNPPNFNYHLDNFKHIISLVSEIPAFNKDILDKYQYVPINAQLLQRRVRDYNLYIDYLLQNGVFRSDYQYIKSEKATGYKFTYKYSTPVKVDNIVKNSLVKQLTKKTTGDMNKEKKYKYLKKWFNEDLNIDFKGAVNYLTRNLNENSANGVKNALLKFNSSYINVHKMKNHDYSFKVDNNVGRLHTNLTVMKSELRNFITYNGQQMVSVDIRNSQPCLSVALVNEKFYTNEDSEAKFNINNITTSKSKFKYISTLTSIPSYIMLVKSGETATTKDMYEYTTQSKNGTLYEYVAEEFEKQTGEKIIERKLLKAIIFTVLFTDNRFIGQVDAEPKRIFKRLFPVVYEVFRMIKSKDSTTLPRLLQTIESNLMLNFISKRISKEYPLLPIYTIHDSIACPVGYEKYIEQVIKEETLKAIGVTPTLKLDYWTPENLDQKSLKAA